MHERHHEQMDIPSPSVPHGSQTGRRMSLSTPNHPGQERGPAGSGVRTFPAISRRHCAAILSLLSLIWLTGCGGTKDSITGHLPASTSRARRTVIEEALSWRGVPYRYRGTTRQGVDCSGFVFRIFASTGITLPRISSEQFKAGEAIPGQLLQPGDLVFFKDTAGPGITHVGIFLGEGWFIHASTSKGVIRSSLEEPYYRKHYAGARRILPP